MELCKRGFPVLFVVLLLMLSGCGGTGAKAPAGQELAFSTAAPPEAEDIWRQAEASHKAGKVSNAIGLWEKIVQKYPNTVLAAKSLNQIGEIYLAQGQAENATRYFDYVVYAYPRWEGISSAKLNLLRVQAQTGKKKQAMKDAVPLWESTADSPEVRFGLAELMIGLYASENDIETAFDWSSSGFSVAKTAAQKEALTKRTVDLLKAADEGMIRRLYKRKPSDFMRVFLDFRYAQIEIEKGQGDMGRERLRTVLGQNPAHPLAGQMQATVRGAKVAVDAAGPANANKIGVLVPLNGPNAKYGDLVVRGLNLAASDWREAHPDQNVTLVIKEAGSEAAISNQSFEELSKKEGVLAVIGPLGIQAHKQVAPLANRDGIPLLSLTQKEDEAKDNSFVLHVFIDSRELVKTLVRHCREKLKFERFACLYPADRYGERLSKLFAEAVQEQGGTMIATASYKERSSDFNEPLQKLMSIAKKNSQLPDLDGTPFEALFIPDQVNTVALIAPQLPFNNIVGTTLLGTNLWSEAPLVQAGGVYVDQAMFATSFYPESRNPIVKSFREKYESQYNATPSYLEAQAYDALTLLLHARSALRSGQTDRNSLFQNLIQSKDFRGVAGVYSVTQKGDLARQYTILQVVNGQLTQVYP